MITLVMAQAVASGRPELNTCQRPPLRIGTASTLAQLGHTVF